MHQPAAARLRRLVRHRATLAPLLDRTWRCLPHTDPAALDDWADAAAGLIDANAGAACQAAFWSASIAGHGRLDLLAAGGRAAAIVCRGAGAGAALAMLYAMPVAMARDDAGFGRWLAGMARLAQAAPDCVAPAAAHTAAMLQDRSGRAFEAFVATGLRATVRDPGRRRAFFALEDPWAAALLTRMPGVPGAAALDRLLTATFAALWGTVGAVRPAPEGRVMPRAVIQGQAVLLPAWTPLASAAAARRLYVAIVAHAGAHLALPPARFAAEALKPIEIALVTLIEDARVEALAMRRYPGLRPVWSPFHRVAPSPPRTAPNLMARLARALFDPAHADPDGFVAKGRALFADAVLNDPASSLRIGRALGHDLGQMRVPFNAREHLTMPEYRDDGAHLWDVPQQPAAPLDAMVQPDTRAGGAGSAGRARDIPPDERGPLIATYPEWDAAAGIDRPDWTALRDTPARLANPAPLLTAMADEATARAGIARLVRRASVGRVVRRRQPDGDGIDLDAAIDAIVALRTGQTPDPRLHLATRPRRQAMATLVLLDTSASGAARTPDGRTVLSVQVLAVALLAEAVAAGRDPLAICAFASDGRADVRLTRIKSVAEPFDADTLGRLAALRPALSTRLGAALRHAPAEFGTAHTARRLLLVMTDGEPSDRDVTADDLVADARRAVLGLRAAGVDVFGVVLDPAGVGSAVAIFGRANTVPVTALAELPARLAKLYFRLACR